MDSQDLIQPGEDSTPSFAERQRVIDGLIVDLKANLSENVQRVIVEGPIVQARRRLENIPKNFLTIFLIMLFRPICAWFIYYSESKATDIQGLLVNPKDFILGMIGQNAQFLLSALHWITLVITTLIFVNIVVAALIFIVSTKAPKYVWKGRVERRQRFDYILASLKGLVSEGDAQKLAQTMQEAYAAVESLDSSPVEREKTAVYFTQAVGHAMLLANMKEDVKQYQQSRWMVGKGAGSKLADLSKKQAKIVDKLADDGVSLQEQFDGVLKTTSELSKEMQKGLEKGVSAQQLLAYDVELAQGKLGLGMSQN